MHLIFAAALPDDAEPAVAEVDGTTDAVAWVSVADVESGGSRRSTSSGTRWRRRPGG